ncbi:MAG: AAA family ATPase [Spirulinaceae cyanobacterium]
MILTSIRLCNFRQFYGKTPEMQLSAGEHNTTIFHGNNGSGKTTLLNAFTWALYEQFTAAFASPQQLINKRAITEADFGRSVDCWVEVMFEHEHKRYQVKRQCYAHNTGEKINYSDTKCFMQIAGDDGRWYPPLEQPEDVIGRILPVSLHHYFFFDGERIDRFFRQDGKSSVAEDTKELIGVKVLDRAIEHLKKAKRKLQQELQSVGDLEIKQLLQAQSKLENQSDRLETRQGEIETKLAQQEEFKQAINKQLLELSGAVELQNQREQLEEREKSLRHTLVEKQESLKKIISTNGYTVFLEQLLRQSSSIIGTMRGKGELPTGIKKQFVQELLEQHRCICGGELLKGSETRKEVETWLDKAGVADVEEAAIRLETQAGEMEQRIPQFWQEVDLRQANIEQARTELGQIDEQLFTISKKLRNYPDHNIQKLQKDLEATEKLIEQLTLEKGGNQQLLVSFNQENAAKQKQIAKQKLKEEKQFIAQRRITATQEAIDRIMEVKRRLEKQFRRSLEQRVQEIFNSISFTPYIPRLSHDYELSLIENTSGKAIQVAASTGENQILSLSFISGVIDRVREWSYQNTLMGPDSSTFPIVMDSPFGSLDEIYRRQVATSIPKLANQLIVLVTKTQWRGEVAEEMENYIGQEYVLVYNSPKSDCQADQIEIAGQTYPLIQRSNNGFEYTEIIPVQRN